MKPAKYLERLDQPSGRCVGKNRRCREPALVGAVKEFLTSRHTHHLCPVCAAEWAHKHGVDPTVRDAEGEPTAKREGCELCGAPGLLAVCRRGCDRNALCHNCQIVHLCWFAEDEEEFWDEETA